MKLRHTLGAEFQEAMTKLRVWGKEVTTAVASLAEENGVRASTTIIEEFESPVAAITKLADKGSYDLIVLGSRGQGGFERLVLGSMVEGVVHYADCSVLIAS